MLFGWGNGGGRHGWDGAWEAQAGGGKRGVLAGQGVPELSGTRAWGPARPFLACICPMHILVPRDAAFPVPPGAPSHGGAAASRPFSPLNPVRCDGREYRRVSLSCFSFLARMRCRRRLLVQEGGIVPQPAGRCKIVKGWWFSGCFLWTCR